MTDDEVKSETWYWLRWNLGPHSEVLPCLPCRDEHGEIEGWDSYHGCLAPDEVTVLGECRPPYECPVCKAVGIEPCAEHPAH